MKRAENTEQNQTICASETDLKKKKATEHYRKKISQLSEFFWI